MSKHDPLSDPTSGAGPRSRPGLTAQHERTGFCQRLMDRFWLWRMVRRDNDCGWEGDRIEAALSRAIARNKSK